MNFNFYNSLILAGTIQGIIFSVVVLSVKKYRNRNLKFLVAMILCGAYNNFQYYLRDAHIINSDEFFKTVFLPIASLVPALLYFYVKVLLYPEKKISLRSKFLYIPFIFFGAAILSYKIAVMVGYENETYYNFLAPLPNAHEFLSIQFMLITLVVLYNKITQFEKSNHDFSPNKIISNLNWLKRTLVLFFVFTVIWLVLMYYSVYIDPEKTQIFYILWIGLSFLIYWLGYVGVYKSVIVKERKSIRASTKPDKIQDTSKKLKNEHIKALEKLLLEERRFLDPQISQEKIAKELNLSTSYFSRLIKAELGTNFSDYLNGLRVEEAKSYLKNPDFNNYTLAAIGLEAGFNSRSAFNSSFKKITGLTPSKFKLEFQTSLIIQ